MNNISDKELCSENKVQTIGAVEFLYAIAEGMLIIAVCFLNGLVFAIFARSKRLENMMDCCILQLAIADFTLGVSLSFRVATYFVKSILINGYVCGFRSTVLYLSRAASVLLVVSLTHDRYASITKPLHFDNSLTPLRVGMVTSAAWLLPLALCFFLPMFWLNPDYGPCTGCDFTTVVNVRYFHYVMIPSGCGTFFLLIVMYSHIFVVARRQQRRISAELRSAKDGRRHSMKRQLKTVKTVFLVCLSTFGLWFPYYIVLSVEVFKPGMIGSDQLEQIRAFMIVLSMFNAALNPLIYTLRLPEYRQEIRRLLRLQN